MMALCWGVPHRWTRPHVIYSNWSLFCAVSLSRSKSGGCNNTAPLQLLGCTSAGRAGCDTDLAECVSAVGDFIRPQGAIPQAFSPFGGLFPYAWGAPNKGNTEGAVSILGKYQARVGSGPAPDPPKKALCHTFSFGGAWNKYRSISRSLEFSLGSVSASRYQEQ